MAKKNKNSKAEKDVKSDATTPTVTEINTSNPSNTSTLFNNDDDVGQVKVNNASLKELKVASDDYIQQYFGRPQGYATCHRHQDVHLVLGWASCIIAAAMSLYSHYTPFNECKGLVTIGVVLCLTLNALLWLWQRYVVKDVIFQGKRKTTGSGRIETETLTVHSSLQKAKSIPNPPLELKLEYTHSANGGKSLIKSKEQVSQIFFNQVFDEEGKMHKDKFSALLRDIEQSML